MKRITVLWLVASVLAATLTTLAAAQSQSLGDYARAVRKDEKKDEKKAPARQFDNDNLPKTDTLSIVGSPTPEPQDKAGRAGEPAKESDKSQAAAASPEAKAADTGKKPEDKSADESVRERQKMHEGFKQKISDQKDKVDLLTRELDVLQREYRLRAAAFYADAGNRLRDQGLWDKQDAQYKQQIAQKQKAVDAAKQQLDDLKEQARKAGVPTSMRE